jgi:hypothetical protein
MPKRKKEMAMGRKSIVKGSTFERKVAKILSEWVGFKLVRTPMSGAWSGSDSDIWPNDPTNIFQLSVECKCTEGWNFHQIMLGIGPFFDWLQQAVDQAHPDQAPILIFSANRKPTYICLPVLIMPLDGFSVSAKLFIFRGQRTFMITVLDQFVQRVRYHDLRLRTGIVPVQTGDQGRPTSD